MSTVLFKSPRQRELSEPVTDHIFSDEYRVEHLAIMNAEGESHKIRRYHRTPRPGFDWRFGFCILRLLNFLHQVPIHEGPFLN